MEYTGEAQRANEHTVWAVYQARMKRNKWLQNFDIFFSEKDASCYLKALDEKEEEDKLKSGEEKTDYEGDFKDRRIITIMSNSIIREYEQCYIVGHLWKRHPDEICSCRVCFTLDEVKEYMKQEIPKAWPRLEDFTYSRIMPGRYRINRVELEKYGIVLFESVASVTSTEFLGEKIKQPELLPLFRQEAEYKKFMVKKAQLPEEQNKLSQKRRQRAEKRESKKQKNRS